MTKTRKTQLEAVKRYKTKNKSRIHKFTVEIYDSKDSALWEWIESQPESRPAVVRRLIREEIERTGWKQ